MMALPRTDSGSLLPAPLHDFPRWLLAPVPLVLLQPVLNQIANHLARSHPGLFVRLESHTEKRFLIDPTDLPFVFLLEPDISKPHLKAYRRHQHVRHDACIAGRFFDLLEMIEGSLDGDALFFTRDLRVSGDTEAVVALRNALDDFDGNIVDTMLSGFGLLHRPAALALSAMRAIRDSSR
jgi:O2-independent ubiquinone biosynthesis accessory factor UbiT